MLFKSAFHSGIRDGTITLTFRRWKTPRVTAGRRYRFGATGGLEVDAIDEVRLDAVTARDARRAGFETAAALKKMVCAGARVPPSTVFRVAFHYVGEGGDPAAPLRADVADAALDEVVTRLARMDTASRRGPWTAQVLALIAENPRVAASRLAPMIDRERTAFKADVRTLKRLGLTISHETGYTLSPRGDAVLARLRPARTAPSSRKRPAMPKNPAAPRERIYAVVRRVPRGRVATYGQIAALAGLGGHARQVGYALSALPEGTRVPWHRVINARGEVSPRSFGGDDDEGRQRALLERERVAFDEAGRVSLKRFQWRPRGSA